MSKLTHKLNEKFVGATIGRPHFGEISKKENGITLIALIITIIVMLILTGVTLGITLGDNGLVNKAKTASEEMQREMDRELLLSAVVGAIGEDGKVNLSAIVLPEGFTGSNGTYTSKNGHTFTVSENGEISYTGSDNVIENGGDTPSEDEPVAFSWERAGFENIETNIEYIAEDGPSLVFLADGTLKVIANGEIMVEIDATNSDNIDETTGKLKSVPVVVNGMEAMGTITMNENEKDIDVNVVATVEGTEQTMSWICIKEEYDNETVYSNNEVLKMLGITDYTGIYAGTWKVLEKGKDGKPTKLMSTRDVVSEYVLGFTDPKAIEAIPVAGTEPTEEEKLQRALWSYKNAVNTLNTVAQEATGIAVARSINLEDILEFIGEENINKEGTGDGTVYNYYYNPETGTVCSKYYNPETDVAGDGTITWSTETNTNYSSQTFIDNNGETVVVDSAGDEVTLTDSEYRYRLTDEQAEKLDIINHNYYWIATTCVECWQSSVTFSVYYSIWGSAAQSFYLDGDGISYSYSSIYWTEYGGSGVRAIVEIPEL